MKKIITNILLLLLILVTTNVLAQTFEIRTSENDKGYLIVQMRETSGTGTPTTSIPINDISFEIRWLTSAGADVAVLCSTNDYNLADALGAKQTSGSYDFRLFQATNTPFYPPNDWVTSQWETIGVFEVTTGSGTADFEISPHLFGGYDLNWNQGDPPVDYLPTINGSVSGYSYPTTIYDFVWTGANVFHGAPKDPTVWEVIGNWDDECSDPAGDYPYLGTENVYIPDVSSASGYYPETTGGYNDGWYCNNMIIANNAHVTVPDLSSATNTYLDIQGNLKVNGKLYLPALGYATVTGSTDIESAEGIEVQADATGVGSFISNGAITYGTSGSAKVQTYITNGAAVNSFYMHLMGPTVDEPNYTGTGTGADLSAFNVAPGNTYAYSWSEPGNVWINQYSNTYNVQTTDGIGLSTDDATAYTMNMTGELMTGDLPSILLTNGGSNYEMLSNPYPSAFEFDAFYGSGSNNTVILGKNWTWDPSAGNYIAYTTGSGQCIQVGQAFFVETQASGGTATFYNINRAHSNTPFRNTLANMLTMKVSGGTHGFSDQLTIRFDDGENVTSGYDKEIEAVKWNSMYENSTQIRSIAEDGTELSINVLPLVGLQGDMVSVPVDFQCGYTAEYTFDFEGIDSFEAGNEVWLEDKKDNDKWIYLNNNPHYTFTATSYEPHDRFIVHFFGPTNINDKDEAQVDIYSWRQYAYIKNVTNEKIKKVSIYNISGSLVREKEIPEGQKLSKIWVSDRMAYYIVQVITEKNVYTNKILITK